MSKIVCVLILAFIAVIMVGCSKNPLGAESAVKTSPAAVVSVLTYEQWLAEKGFTYADLSADGKVKSKIAYDMYVAQLYGIDPLTLSVFSTTCAGGCGGGSAGYGSVSTVGKNNESTVSNSKNSTVSNNKNSTVGRN